MQRVKSFFINFMVLTAILFFNCSFSTAQTKPADECIVPSTALTQQRILVIKDYLKLLGEGKFKELIPFFTPDAVVSDAIKGKKSARNYYMGLYAYLIHPNLTFYDVYIGIKNPNVLAAHFNMKITTKRGMENRGEIVDLFVFDKNSSKIKKLYIQSNTTDFAFS